MSKISTLPTYDIELKEYCQQCEKRVKVLQEDKKSFDSEIKEAMK
ncbi:MAG: hypothetical protein WCA39_07945 [Nitrososphaeraceae archaeon]